MSKFACRIVLALAGLFFLACLAGALYAFAIEPSWLRVRTLPVPVSKTHGKTLRVVHLTDLHWGRSSPRYLERVFRAAAAQKPDVIVLTGDYMRRIVEPEDRPRFSALLKILSDAAPAYAVPGNHDGGLWARRGGGYENTVMIRGLITAGGIRYLENAYACPTLRGMRVCIGGLGDVWAGAFTPELFLPAMDRENADVRILLLHNPDAKAFLDGARWDLLLAGHTHGGQVALPVIGSPWAPVRDARVLRGLAPYKGRWLHVSPGVGMSGGHVRFGVRPEVSVLDVAL